MADPRKEALERAERFKAQAATGRSVQSLQDQFTAHWFPGGDAFPDAVIRLHDAAHQFSNISPTERGEAQQSIVDFAGTQSLYEKTGARGFTNSLPFMPDEGLGAGAFSKEVVDRGVAQIVKESSRVDDPLHGRADQRGLAINDPARLQFPAITEQEAEDLMRRGREFYTQVGDEWRQGRNLLDFDPASVHFEQPFTANGIEQIVPVNAAAESIHNSGDAIAVKGGYDRPGAISFGPMQQRLNRPLHQVVASSDLMNEAAKVFHRQMRDGSGLSEPEQVVLRGKAAKELGLPDFVFDPFDGGDSKVWSADHDRTIKEAASPAFSREMSSWAYAVEPKRDGVPGGPEIETLRSDLAAVAKQRGRIAGAIRTGARGALDAASAVPLADPEFQQAIERQDLGKAAGIVARDYAIGTAAAPVVGMGAGVLQRTAPAAAARVLPAVAAAGRLSNPVIAVSQLGGDQRQTARQRAAAFTANPAASGGMGPAADPQLLRAEAARRRGGKWGITTPWGRLALPELGLSEAGGLFFR